MEGKDPLGHLRVLDISQSAAAPYSAQLLADFGAQVVSVEPPGGGDERGLIKNSMYPNVGRNKESIVIDFKTEEGIQLMYDLIEAYDVLIHNYKPDTIERLKLDYKTVREINDSLIYCSITGFGETGPYRDRGGFDPLVQAMSGLMSLTGEPDRKPSRIGASIIDFATGIYAAFGVMVALEHRTQTGEGQKIEASLFDTAGAMMGYWYTYYSKYGTTPQRMGDSWAGYSPVGVFDTKDDPVYLSIPYQGLWERFCQALDRDEWIKDARFDTGEARIKNSEELRAVIQEEFSNYHRDELLGLLLGKGVTISEMKTVEEAANDPQLRQRGTIAELEDTEGNSVLAATTPLHMSKSHPADSFDLSTVGEDTRSILQNLELSEKKINDLFEEGVVE